MAFHTKHLISSALAILLSITGFAHAQEKFPSRQVTLVVPQAAGGANDAIARVVAPRLSERLWQPEVVQNQPGASGNIGADTVAKSPADV